MKTRARRLPLTRCLRRASDMSRPGLRVRRTAEAGRAPVTYCVDEKSPTVERGFRDAASVARVSCGWSMHLYGYVRVVIMAAESYDGRSVGGGEVARQAAHPHISAGGRHGSLFEREEGFPDGAGAIVVTLQVLLGPVLHQCHHGRR